MRIWLSMILMAIWVMPVERGLAEEPIQLGAVFNLSGRQSVLDEPSWKGAQLALQEVNAAGGMLGRSLEIPVVDGQSKAVLVAEQTQKLVETHPGVVALFGLSDTDMALTAGQVAAQEHRAFLTTGATSPKLTQEVPEYLFLACFGDNVQAAAAAEYAFDELDARTAAVIYDSERTYTLLLQGYFQEGFEALGGKVVSVTSYYPAAMENLTEGVKAADVIFLASEETQEGVKAVQLLRKAGFDVPILGGDGDDTPELWAAHPELSDVYYTAHAWLSPENSNPKVTAFLQAYAAAHPGEEPTSFTALGFDGVNLLVDAIRRAGSADPEAVRNALAGTTDFEGVTGTFSYPQGSRVPVKSVAIIKVEQGKTGLAKMVTPGNVPTP